MGYDFPPNTQICADTHMPPPNPPTLPAFRDLNIYRVNDLLSARGWHLNALQQPPALHMCFTPAHSPQLADALLRDLGEAVDAVLAEKGAKDGEGGGLGGQQGCMFCTVPALTPRHC
jgi:hypothetical protein